MQHLCALFVTNLFYFLAQGLVFDLWGIYLSNLHALILSTIYIPRLVLVVITLSCERVLIVVI